jgi:hypothetical protein
MSLLALMAVMHLFFWSFSIHLLTSTRSFDIDILLMKQPPIHDFSAVTV